MSPMETDLNNAIAGVIARHEEGGFVTKWLALIESLGPDGQPGLWTATSGGLMPWDTQGLLTHALNMETAQTIGMYLRDSDDD